MTPQSKLADLTIGIGSHCDLCCPHVLLGVRITGSPNTMINGLPVSRLTDFAIHTCPHCVVNMAVTGSQNVNVNSLPAHRVGDVVFEFCGFGITVTGSQNVFTN